MASPFPEDGLLAEAGELAERNVKVWVRRALRETAIQSLRDHLELVPEGTGGPDAAGPDGGASGKVILRLKAGAFGRAQDLCRLVAGRWRDKLRIHGWDQACEWIQAVVDQESDVLFHCPDEEALPSQQRRRPAPPSPPPPGPAHSPHGAPTSRAGGLSQCVTNIARLRGLGCDPREELDPEAAARQIDEWAAHRRRLVDWPYGWKVIENACDALASRLHNSKKRERGTEELVLVPKSMVTLLPTDDESSAAARGGSATRSDAEAFILRRKRKSRHKVQQASRGSDHVRDEDEAGELRANPLEADVPRSASEVGECQWSAHDLQLVEEDRVYLEKAYLHPVAPDSGGAEGTSTLLGALSEVGRFHHWRQQAVDGGGPEAGKVGAHRLAHNGLKQRWSTKERLADHKVAQDVRESEQASKVIRAVDRRSGRHWLELDLAHCLLDLPVGSSESAEGTSSPELPKRRRLYYFDSLEISLLDEDQTESAS